jgi:hypothetical protein
MVDENLGSLNQAKSPQKGAVIRLFGIRCCEQLVSEKDRVSARLKPEGLGLSA